MAVTITATLTCDMCGREQSLPLKEAWRWGKLETDAPATVELFPHWEMLGRDGYPVKDYRYGEGKVLCEQCANRYRDAIAEKDREIDALFS